MSKVTLPILLITVQSLQILKAFKFQFEDGHANFYEGFSHGKVVAEYFNRTEKNIRGNCTLNFTGENCSAKITIFQTKGNTWDLYATFNKSYCDIWKNENYITNQFLEQLNAPKECPHPSGITLVANGFNFDTTPLLKMMPTGVRFSKSRYVVEIDCNGQRAFDFWTTIINDYTDIMKRRSKPGQKRKPGNN